MPTGERKKSSESAKEDLNRLLKLLITHPSKQQLPSLKHEGSNNNNNNSPPSKYSGILQHQNSEAIALEAFSSTYQNERQFSTHPLSKQFDQIFSAIVKNRLCSSEWTAKAPAGNNLCMLICLRLFLRDTTYQKHIFKLDGVKTLAERLHAITDQYLCSAEQPFTVDILKEITNIFQKLAVEKSHQDWLIASRAHIPLVKLLAAKDIHVLHCALHGLISLAKSPETRHILGELNCVEQILTILKEYGNPSKILAAKLLRHLCHDSSVREWVKIYDGVPTLVSLLHSDNMELLWNVVWCFVLLAEDMDTSNEIRITGGLPILLSLLQDRKYTTDRHSTTSVSSASSLGRLYSVTGTEQELDDVTLEQTLSLQSACCAALTELVLNDSNAQQLVQNNGIYYVGVLIFPQTTSNVEEGSAVINLQQHAFRALRFLFSMERNRQLFKRLFPPELFEMFIDVGHYEKEMGKYKPIVEKLNSLAKEERDKILDKFLETNQNKEPTQSISGYFVYEHLGSGAFGSVYKVRKNSGGNFLALKEINPSIGKTAKEKAIESIVSELSIIKEQLKHPNVVKYYRTFKENDKLYVLMELIEGAPLYEHFNSLKEKKDSFTEERIWNIFIQMVLALRYLHREKKIVHRDLTPNNIMLGENDKVVITDFGLAKQRHPDASEMTSVVGTILYNCPEIIQNEPYGEKADIWALGCILYQMCALEPPFHSKNMLALASKIVAADYIPLKEGAYSDKVSKVIGMCLTPKQDDRPDIVGVAGSISEEMMKHMDQLNKQQINLEKRLAREKKRTHKHFHEANLNMQNYQRLFIASQERYDKLVNLASSGGASSFKSETDDVFESADEANTPVNQGAGGDFSVLKSTESGIVDDDTSSGDSLESSGSSAVLGANFALSNSRGGLNQPRPPQKARNGSVSKRHAMLDPHAVRRALNNHLSPVDANFGSSGERTIQRSISGSYVETKRRQNSSTRNRPPSAAATLTISPRKVRQIKDPILEMLHMIHKIIFICQLPPTLTYNPRRRVIECFKRALFSPQSSSVNLKNELKKVITGSKDLVDLNFGLGEASYLFRQASNEEASLQVTGEKPAHSTVDPHDPDIGISYEQLHTFIESVLKEYGYYNMSPNARNRTLPLAPITGSVPCLLRQTSLEAGVL
ncbi:serine/threonine-protein kinase Nek10-like isoform X3 [Anneissia japonica]|uniref:serine/threonine-protein kinase Nek10-like isoform X3 n=1 Tax=Anneissia japonica TaxID=1529436 RepID=UPI0014255CE2|nr:serine/threonine-protein kinase Nek10-like isoform X3 [Anneissia japonica]